MVPLQIGTNQQFAAFRDFLHQSGFSEPSVAKRLGLGEVLDYIALKECTEPVENQHDVLSFLIRLFVLEEAVEQAELNSHIPGAVQEVVRELGLVCPDHTDPKLVLCPVWLYPIQDLLIVSDRRKQRDHPNPGFEDVVYPAITPNTREFLEILPVEPCEKFLDLCSGTGVGALVVARYAKHAWATDITERSTHFAEFNRLLNGLENVTAARGNLYEPVDGQFFDRIAAHPPYVPVIKPAEIYYGGGQDGEQITRKIIEGLPGHLQSGGRFYCVALGSDRVEPWEDRIRSWLAEFQSDFDIGVIVDQNIEVSRFAAQSAIETRAGKEVVEYWKKWFEDQGVKELLHGTILVQRKRGDRKVFTVRRQEGRRCGSAEVEWLLRWETAASEPGIAEVLSQARPLTSPHMELLVLHKMRDSQLTPERFTLLTDYPFRMECKVQPWTGFLLDRCDGTRTVNDHYEFFKQKELIHPQTPLEEFIRYIRVLISGGFLELEAFRLPEAVK